jgi:hypothetical protein
VLPGFFPEHAIETGVEYAVDLEDRVEVAVTEFAVGISDVVCDYEEEIEREFWGRGRHCDGIGVEERVVERKRFGNLFMITNNF